MRRLTAITVAVLCSAAILLSRPVLAQQPRAARPILIKVMPVYPDLARPMRLEGTVKATVVVEPNGTARSVQGTGGHPLLLKAAQDALYKWKWAPAGQASTEYVELRFHPD
jgi:TonB family protein